LIYWTGGFRMQQFLAIRPEQQGEFLMCLVPYCIRPQDID